ncbi:YidB family protein [Reyranella sp.]|uniref:YidB family protein n=1 Tax=Reyranella sp. TaxID=1929291 RepID=UPI003BA97D6A
MGLLDILGGGRSTSSGRLSPIAMAVLGLLAYRKLNTAGRPEKAGQTAAAEPDFADRLRDFFQPSATGGPTAKGVIGALLTGGLMDLVRQFQGAGKADTVDSWVSRGPNQQVSPNDLSKVLTAEQLAFLSERTGLSREELLAGLSERLPQVVDALTPEGRVPTAQEVERTA